MKFFLNAIVIVTMLFLFGGCTLSFKAKEIELEGERQRVKNIAEFELEEATIL